jgi:hypothetical protein
MANIKNFGLIGVGNDVQFGKSGPRLINNSGVFAFRNAAANADADITAGNLTLSGNLEVNGTQTVVNTTSITTADKTFILSNGASTDTAADGSGFEVQGATLHTFLFDNGNSAFTGSENMNIVAGKQYMIGGVPVLSSTTLGSNIVNSGLTSVGTLTSLHVSGTSALDGAVTAGSTLAVTGNTTVGGTLGVTGATTLAGLTAGATTLASAGVTGDATVGGNLTVTGTATTGALTAASALISNLAGTGVRSVSVDANGNLVAGGSSSNVTATTGTFGDIEISGDTIATQTTDANLVLAPNGAGIVTAPALTATGAVIAGSFSTTGTLAAGASTLGDTTVGTLGAGNTAITGTLSVSGLSTLADVNATTITTTGNGTIGGNLTVDGTLTAGATTLGATGVTGGLTTDTLTATGNGSIGGTLTVTGAASTGALTAASVTASNLTAGQVVFAGTAGALTDSSALTFNSTTGVLTATGFATSGLTIGATMLTGLATPAVDADAANKKYVDDQIASHVSAGTANAGRSAYAAFAYTDTAKTVVSAVTGFVHRVKVYVSTAFDDASAGVQVGTVIGGTAVANALVSTSDTDATVAACYVVELAQPVAAADLVINIAAGTSTAGAGYVVIEWI